MSRTINYGDKHRYLEGSLRFMAFGDLTLSHLDELIYNMINHHVLTILI